MTCEKHWEGVAGVKTLRMLLARKPSADTARPYDVGSIMHYSRWADFQKLVFLV